MATISKRYVTVLGPVKMEVANLTDVNDNDTYNALIQNPDFAIFLGNTADATVGGSPSISDKTLTFNNSNLSSTAGVLIVFGF